MSSAETTVVAFPTDRDDIRRVARAHARAERPMASGLYASPSDQIVYEHAYQEHARQIAGEIAECA